MNSSYMSHLLKKRSLLQQKDRLFIAASGPGDLSCPML